MRKGKSRKILLVGNFMGNSRGTRFYCEDLADRLRRGGHSVVTTSRFRNRVLRLLDMCTTAAFGHDLYVAYVEVYSGRSFFWAECVTFLLSLRKIPVILALHGGRLPAFAKSHPRRITCLVGKAEAIVTPSRYIQSEVVSFDHRIRYIPNAIEVGSYIKSVRAVQRVRLCWLRAFDSTYNPMMAVHTLAAVRKSVPEATLTMIGPVKNQKTLDEVVEAIRQLGLGRHVEILGPVPKTQVPSILAEFDIFLNTTCYESFGVAVMEAAASGMPIVSTAVGELPYLWCDGEDIILVPNGDAQAMAKAVKTLITDPFLCEKLSSNARRKAERFDWSTVLPHWEKVFAQSNKDKRN